MAVPIIAPALAFVAKSVISKALDKVKGMFNWKQRDEVNRFEHRKEEIIALANQLDSGLKVTIRKINSGSYSLSEAIREHAGQVERWNRFNYYIPLGSIPWHPFRPFDYPSERAGLNGLYEVKKAWMPVFEKVLDTAFPTYPWEFVLYKRSPTSAIDSASDPVTLKANASKLGIPVGLLGLGLLLSLS